MAQEEKERDGTIVNCGTESGGSNTGDDVRSSSVHRAVMRAPLSDYPPEAITAAINDFAIGFTLCALTSIVLCFRYPDRVNQVITVVGPALGVAITFFLNLWEQRNRRGSDDERGD